MSRLLLTPALAIGLMVGSLACAQPASAQGLWFGGIGFGGPGYFGPGFYGSGFSPYGFGNAGFYSAGRYYAPARYGYGYGYPMTVRRPVVAVPVAPRYAAYSRPAVRHPLNKAYRRTFRRGW